MTSLRILLPFLAILGACTKTDVVVEPPPDTTGTAARWELTFSDDFDGDTLDPSRWVIREHWPFMNGELGYYRYANVQVRDGILRLRSDREKIQGPWGMHDYSTAWVQTLPSQLYGRWEVRARLPGGGGVHSAHWMLPADTAWPPEIDIVELLGNAPTYLWFHNHWRDTATGEPDSYGSALVGFDATRDFHTYAVEWEPWVIRWYVDDVQRFVSARWVPAERMFVVLSTAVGGNWPGPPDSTTAFPVYHEIDWVRVYRRAD